MRKGLPSLEFPVRKGAKSSCRRQRRGDRRAKGGERSEKRREGESGTLREGEVRLSLRGGEKREGDKKIRKMGESSPDLSLRLRQGSSDSRDSFYMDFAQVRGKRGEGEASCRLKIICLESEPRVITRKDFGRRNANYETAKSSIRHFTYDGLL